MVDGRWLLLLDNKYYPKHWSMRLDAVRKNADKKAPTYMDYDFCPCFPVTRLVIPDFDNTTDDIEAIIADMITKLKVNKDELSTNSCQ